jgi:hypothetical protein
MTSVRLTTDVFAEARLRNELAYVFRDMEMNLRDGINPKLNGEVTSNGNCETPGSGFFCIEVTLSDNTLRTYVYDSTNQILSRGGLTLSRGVLQPYAELKDFDNDTDFDTIDRLHLEGCLQNPQPPGCSQVELVFSQDNQIINASFRVQRAGPGTTPSTRWISVTKSIYLRRTP